VGQEIALLPAGVDNIHEDVIPAVQTLSERWGHLLQNLCTIQLLNVVPEHAWLLPPAAPQSAHHVFTGFFKCVRCTTRSQRARQPQPLCTTGLHHQQPESFLKRPSCARSSGP